MAFASSCGQPVVLTNWFRAVWRLNSSMVAPSSLHKYQLRKVIVNIEQVNCFEFVCEAQSDTQSANV